MAIAYGGSLAVRGGDISAFAPLTDVAFEAIREGRFISPLMTDVQTIPIPVGADFMHTVDFNRETHLDIYSCPPRTVFVFPLKIPPVRD